MTIDELRRLGVKRLTPLYGLSEAQSILSYLLEAKLGLTVSALSLRQAECLDAPMVRGLEEALAKLEQHEPIQYVTGIAYFWEFNLRVTPDVLIPRQETEELVDWVLKENRHLPSPSLLDIGTGSGCIALSLASEMPRATVKAVDISPQALQVAQQNATALQVKVEFMQMDILQAKEQDFSNLDIIVSNPPYIKEQEKVDMMPHVLEHEPGMALFVPNEDPLLFYRKISELGNHWLKPHGKLYFEINEALGQDMMDMMGKCGYTNVRLRKDLNGKDRMVSGEKV
jgi:release factor glutamine methyltransferase